ncbi:MULTISPECIES: glycosyltransferase family 2 protein [Pseudoalteromonas]|uniref:glycosyltransferase family 2 protein n=1 Tax=Pseudoalteromonas TaxID=53246 RepID=UPI000C34EA70|nr:MULTISPECIES: glycosyltransferase [Pseudoalteromonas]PKG65940.1 glycosyl transferase [Pseudoalteromonas arctica]PKG70743.1 glycosyl transferase [Pseudoalteromonas sp. GutCa3]
MNLQKVTVYITTYNRLELLKRAVESVLNQSYQDIEIIVADDGSTDGTHAYLKEMQEQGLLLSTINETGKSKGACYGRNKALSLATGYFITGLDDDDYFENWRIDSFVQYWFKLEQENTNDIAGLFDGVLEVRENGEFTHNNSECVDYDMLRSLNYIGNQVFTKRDYFLKIDGFDEKMPALQDWDTWIRLAKQYGIFKNIKKNSYIIVQNHGLERISEKKANNIRKAFERLNLKHKPSNLKERSSRIVAMCNYSQINVKVSELLILLITFEFRVILRRIKKALERV